MKLVVKVTFLVFMSMSMMSCLDIFPFMQKIVLTENEIKLVKKFENYILNQKYDEASGMIYPRYMSKKKVEELFKNKFAGKKIVQISFRRSEWKPQVSKGSEINKKTNLSKDYFFADQSKKNASMILYSYKNGDVKLMGFNLFD